MVKPIGRNFGVFAHHFVRGSSASFGAEATSCEKVSRMSVDGCRRKCVTDEKTCAIYKIAFAGQAI